MEITIITYLKARPFALCTIQIITTIVIIDMYLLYFIYVHLQPKCKYTRIENRDFQPMKMNSEVKSNTSTDANEGQDEIRLPPLEDAKEPTSRNAPRVNKRNGKKQTYNKQE